MAWNPREAFNLTVANEDCCLYTYDIRKLQSAACVHKACPGLQLPQLSGFFYSLAPALGGHASCLPACIPEHLLVTSESGVVLHAGLCVSCHGH